MCDNCSFYRNHYEDNKKKKKTYYEVNKEEILKQVKEYQESKKEELKKKRSEGVECECGGHYTVSNRHIHMKTKKHIVYLEKKGN